MAFLLRVSNRILIQPITRGYAKAAAQSNLAALRKSTGYSFSLCKKALEQNNNDLAAAEQWLNKQAENLEWSKNKNVTARKTNQGLIGLYINGQAGAMIELNCETDFVARNENFLSLLHTSARSCTEYVAKNLAQSKDSQKVRNHGVIIKSLGLTIFALQLILDVEELKRATVPDSGKALQEHINQSIETIKENITFGRAIGFRVGAGVILHGCSHPMATINENVFYGKYGAMVALKAPGPLENVPKNLCQHIVGMNPKRIGKDGVDEPNSDADNEECLIFQEFVLDPSKTVAEVLQENQIELLDFHRFGCDDEKTTAV